MEGVTVITKEEFEKSEKPLVFIVCIDPVTGASISSIWKQEYQEDVLLEWSEEYPERILCLTPNQAAYNETVRKMHMLQFLSRGDKEANSDDND